MCTEARSIPRYLAKEKTELGRTRQGQVEACGVDRGGSDGFFLSFARNRRGASTEFSVGGLEKIPNTCREVKSQDAASARWRNCFDLEDTPLDQVPGRFSRCTFS